MTLYLTDPNKFAISAKLIPDQEIIIYDQELLDRLKVNGIVVSRAFEKEYSLSHWKVYPSDDKKIFAKAFAQFKFIHGLQQGGHKWRTEEEINQLEKALGAHFKSDSSLEQEKAS